MEPAATCLLFISPPTLSMIWYWCCNNNRSNNEGVTWGNNLLTGLALRGKHSIKKKVKNGSRRPRPKCIPWPENELAAHVTHDLHRKRPVSLYNDRSAAESAWAHSMTRNPSLLSCAIEIDNKTPYWFGCRRRGSLFKTPRRPRLNLDRADNHLRRAPAVGVCSTFASSASIRAAERFRKQTAK